MRNAPCYSEGGLVRLSRACLLATVVCSGFALAGCSTTYHLGGLFGGKDEPERTASTAPAVTPAGVQGPLEADLAAAKAAAETLLARGIKDASAPWEDPRTGARGTVTALATSYAHEGSVCQNFLASYVLDGRETWYQGGACQSGSGWQVREFKPLQRT